MHYGIRKSCLVCMTAFTLWGMIVPSIGLAKDEFRSWGDAKGKNKIKAKFVKMEDDLVTLEKEDGDEVEIPLKKLSAADQKYVTEAMKETDENPFKSKSDDPFKPKSKAKPSGKTKPGKAAQSEDESDGTRVMTPNLSSADHILLSQSEKWEIEIPTIEKPVSTGKPKVVQIPAKTNFFEKVTGLAFNRGQSAKAAVVGFIVDPPGGKGPLTRVALCDLTTGKSGTPAVMDGKMAPIALHDDGRQIIMRSEEFGFGKQDRLEVWTIAGKKVTKSLIWTPYDSYQNGDRDVMWAEFVNPETLATSSRNGKIVVWKFPEIEPVCQFDTENGAVPALSPDRKLIAYSTGKDVGLFDVEEREVVAQQPTPINLQWPYMAFSPSSKRLACIAFDKILVWDLATGNHEKTIPCTGLNVHGSIDFPDDDFILGGGHFLIDLENQVKFWTYDGAEQVRTVNGLTYFAVTDGDKKPGAIIPMQIPHPAAKELLKKAVTDPNLFVLKAKTAVRIDVNGISDPAQREKVAKGLSKQLAAIDCKGGSSGTIDLVATVEGPKEINLQYRHAGSYKFKEYISRVKFVYQNQTVWETAMSNGPGFFVHLAQGENLESHLRAREKPNYDVFEKVELPKFLQKPSAGQGPGNSLTLGKSQVTAGGLR